MNELLNADGGIGQEALASGWERLSQRLRAEIGDDLYTSWFGRMEAESANGGNLCLSVPTRFLKSWIENHYLGKLRKLSAAEFPQLSDIAIRVRTQGAFPVGTAATRANAMQNRNAARLHKAATEPLQTIDARMLAQFVPVSETPQAIDNTQTFASFRVGQSNQLAHAAAQRVANAAQGAAVTFNPLFIHAAAGYGKTHLLNAIAQRIRTTQPLRKVMMLTAERFMYSFIHAVRQRDTLAFKDQFLNVDVLLIDDFQFLQGRAIQQEFCHSFNSLVDQRRQVVVAADVPPSQLDTIDQRMRSRLMGGLVVDIEAPDVTLRREIVQARHDMLVTRDPAMNLSPEILDLVAEKVAGSGRELEGAMNKLLAFQQFQKQPLTLEVTHTLLHDASMTGGPDQGKVKIENILKIVGQHYNVAKADLLSPRRARTVVLPRQIGMYLAKKLTSRSLPEIGRRFGGRDHSTVLHAVRKIEEALRGNEKMAKDVAILIRLIEQGGP